VDGVDGLDTAAGLALSPDNAHLYVASTLDNAVAVFQRNRTTGELDWVEAEFDGVGGVDGLFEAHGVAVSPDGSHVYVAGAGENAVAVFDRDRATGELDFAGAVFDGVGGVSGLDGVIGLAFSPDGSHLYTTAFADDAVAVFDRDAATGMLTFVEKHVDGVNGVDGLDGVNAVTVSPDGSDVYVVSLLRLGEGEDALAVFNRDAGTGALSFVEAHFDDVGDVDGLAQASSVIVEPEGGHVYVAAVADGAVAAFARDFTTGALTFVEAQFDGVGGVDGLESARHVAMSPDGAHLYVASLGDGGVVTLFDVTRSGLCSDGFDNDLDGAIDTDDLGCDDAADDSERSAGAPCDDGLENDGDGLADYPQDPGCANPGGHREETQCQDGLDNDGDQYIDFDGGASVNGGVPIGTADPDCFGFPDNREGLAPRRWGCGFGPELALLLLPGLALWWLRRRKGEVA
jgi:DNA-binding beta-propeller fold protein YncE